VVFSYTFRGHHLITSFSSLLQDLRDFRFTRSADLRCHRQTFGGLGTAIVSVSILCDCSCSRSQTRLPR
jgi:hypothetical protein